MRGPLTAPADAKAPAAAAAEPGPAAPATLLAAPKPEGAGAGLAAAAARGKRTRVGETGAEPASEAGAEAGAEGAAEAAAEASAEASAPCSACAGAGVSAGAAAATADAPTTGEVDSCSILPAPVTAPADDEDGTSRSTSPCIGATVAATTPASDLSLAAASSDELVVSRLQPASATTGQMASAGVGAALASRSSGHSALPAAEALPPALLCVASAAPSSPTKSIAGRRAAASEPCPCPPWVCGCVSATPAAFR